MVRHSAAHRGAEEQILPLANSRGVGLLAFNSTCYGRLLRPLGDSPGVGAADCYRYTLAQAGVTACWSAPVTLEQLRENLGALENPTLSAERVRHLISHGDRVYEEDRVFRQWVRSR
jgi:aryl-alcohol dehydrogenase-like predicted oxidoreductase